MRVDFGLVLAMIIEYVLFVYYADTLFYRKRNKYVCYAIIAAGYIIHFITCMMGNLIVNIIVSVLVSFIGFLLCYYITARTAAFQSIMLLALMFADECIVIAIPYLNITFQPIGYSPQQSFMLTIISRFIYMIEIMFLSRVFSKKQKNYESLSLTLVSIPAMSIVMIWMLMIGHTNLMSYLCILIAVINIIVFALDQKLFRKELETVALKAEAEKDSLDYEEYALLSEKYEQTRIIRHDINEHLSVLNTLIDENPKKAKEYLKEIYEKEESAQYVRFSNNKILNILLSKKRALCVKQGIEFIIDPIQADLDFIGNMDIVTLFSNLINNAIESSIKSEDKKIFLNIGTVNENFVVIKMDNSCDVKPVVINSKLRTIKDNENLHGIGMNSIRRVVKSYNGDLKWSYNEKEKVFNTTAIINNMTVGSKN